MSVFTNSYGRAADEAAAYTAAVLDLVGTRDPLEVLRGTAAALGRSLEGLTDEQLARPEREGKWAIRHVVRHLADSEIVWGYRLRLVLAQDRPTITGYDQDRWATRLRYDQADVRQALREFEVLRAGNLWLLSGSPAEDLKRVGVHSERGDESVEHMIRMYAGHDTLHLRQIGRIRASVGAGSLEHAAR
jgi:hypothetical protein